jgi:hypothetical protein
MVYQDARECTRVDVCIRDIALRDGGLGVVNESGVRGLRHGRLRWWRGKLRSRGSLSAYQDIWKWSTQSTDGDECRIRAADGAGVRVNDRTES